MEIEPRFPSPVQIRTLKELTALHPHMVAGDPGDPERVIYEQVLGLGGERNVPLEVIFPLMTTTHKSQLEKLGITRWRIDRTRYNAQDLATTELNRSKGHVNTDSEIEIFQVLSGRIRMLLQNPKDLSRAWYVDAGLCECVLIPPGWYHSTHVLEGPSGVINLVNREELADWSEKAYGVFQAAYTFARGVSGEIIPIVNPVYSEPPSLIALRSTQLPIIQDFSGSLFNLVHQAPLELLEALAGDILSANSDSALILPQQALDNSIIQDYCQRLGPEAFWERGYRVIKSYETGGLGSQPFLAIDSSGRLSIVKYSDQDGVDGNGISWLRKQAARTREYGAYLGQHVPAILESVEIDGQGDRRPSFFYSMEFRPLETLAEYLLYNPAVVYDMGKLAFSFLYALIDKAHALTVPISSLQLNEDTKEATAHLEFDASQESRIFSHLQIRTQLWNFLKNHRPLVDVLQKMGEEPETWLTRTVLAEAVNLIGVAPDRLKDDPSGSLSLTYYVLTTILLNDFLQSLGIGVEREDYIR